MIAPPRPLAPSEQWFYLRDGKRFGPTDLEGLNSMADSLHMRRDCLVQRLGSQTSQAAETLQGLRFPAEPPPLPVATPLPTGFYRSADDRVLLGLCGGLAHRFGLPVLGVRAVMLLLGPVGWAYPLCWFLETRPTKAAPRH